jgi:hypothetical protein
MSSDWKEVNRRIVACWCFRVDRNATLELEFMNFPKEAIPYRTRNFNLYICISSVHSLLSELQ